MLNNLILNHPLLTSSSLPFPCFDPALAGIGKELIPIYDRKGTVSGELIVEPIYDLSPSSLGNNLGFAVLSSPLEQFETTQFVSFVAPILGDFVISLTNVGFYSLLVLVLGIGYHALSANNHQIVPSKWSLSLESSYATLHSMVKEQVGSANEIYVPFIYSLFWFIVLANLIGNVPYSFAFTSSAIVAMGLSVMIFLGVTILGLMRHKIHFFSFFVPAGTPLALVPLLVLIELISYFARAFSLGVRLFANIVAGHTLLKILSGFLYPALTSGILLFFVTLLPMAIFIALVGLEIAVSLIQAYVFTILTCSYLKDAIELH